MGNTESNTKDNKACPTAGSTKINPTSQQTTSHQSTSQPDTVVTNAQVSVIKENFKEDNGTVKEDSVLKLLDEWLCMLLVHFVRKSSGLADESVPLTIDAFASTCGRLLSGGNALMVEMFAGVGDTYAKEDIKKMLIVCCRAAGVQCRKCDIPIAEAICRSMITGSEEKVTSDELRTWVEQNCPRLFSSLLAQLRAGLLDKQPYSGQVQVPASSVCSPFMLWLLTVSLPKTYLSISEQESQLYHAVWDVMYNSDEDGLSINRFELKVMGYRSPNVMLLELQNGGLVAVAIDEEWRQSSTKWGGPNTVMVQFAPEFRRCSGSGSLYFQTKMRNLQQGFAATDSYTNEPLVKLDGQLSEAAAIEVWGCGDAKAKAGQLAQQLWEKRQTEKSRKVPLPGKWEENPDMILLEMAGVHKSYVDGPVEPID